MKISLIIVAVSAVLVFGLLHCYVSADTPRTTTSTIIGPDGTLTMCTKWCNYNGTHCTVSCI